MPQPAIFQFKSRNGMKKYGLLAGMRGARRWWPFMVGGLIALCRLRSAWALFPRTASSAPEPVQLEEQESFDGFKVRKHEMIAYLCFAIVFWAFRACGSRIARFTLEEAGGKAILRMGGLNQAVLYKEVMLAYMNAAILEPVISIGAAEELSGKQLMVHLGMLFSIFWWIYILTDAFDCSDVSQAYQYKHFHEKVDKKPGDYEWLTLQALDDSRNTQKAKLQGSVIYDLGLWFILFCIFAAVVSPGITHRDVFHAYAMLVLWIGLMPMEFCLPLQELDNVDDLEDWRQFIQDRCGITLNIVA